MDMAILQILNSYVFFMNKFEENSIPSNTINPSSVQIRSFFCLSLYIASRVFWLTKKNSKKNIQSLQTFTMHKLQLFICRAAELVALSQYHLKKSGQILKWHSSKHSYYYLLRKLCEAYIYLALASSSRCPGVPTETKMRHKLWSAANTIPLPNPLKNLHAHINWYIIVRIWHCIQEKHLMRTVCVDDPQIKVQV